jgi:putative ABC transport system permease protein
VIGLIAGLIGVPVGIAVHSYVVPIMGHVAGTTLPGVDLDVYHLRQLALLMLGGLAIAVAGALLPAGWAARASTATALRDRVRTRAVRHGWDAVLEERTYA